MPIYLRNIVREKYEFSQSNNWTHAGMSYPRSDKNDPDPENRAADMYASYRFIVFQMVSWWFIGGWSDAVMKQDSLKNSALAGTGIDLVRAKTVAILLSPTIRYIWHCLVSAGNARMSRGPQRMICHLQVKPIVTEFLQVTGAVNP
jgi:hypothetical protein